MLAEYRRRYPQVVVDISFEDRAVDLVEEGYDVAMRITTDASSLPAGLIARPVRPSHFVLGASRDYIRRKGVPKTLEDLEQHEFIGLANIDSLHIKGPAGIVEVPINVVLRYRSMVGVAHAVTAGIGIAPLPVLTFEDPLYKDQLVPLLTDLPLRGGTLYMVYVSRKYVPLKIRTFIDFMIEQISSLRDPNLAVADPPPLATAG
jgi:DNA-binding transcriptional LysR family regulator